MGGTRGSFKSPMVTSSPVGVGNPIQLPTVYVFFKANWRFMKESLQDYVWFQGES